MCVAIHCSILIDTEDVRIFRGLFLREDPQGQHHTAHNRLCGRCSDTPRGMQVDVLIYELHYDKAC